MSYEIQVDHDNQMVVAHVSGQAAREEHKAAREEAAQACSDNGYKRLLVDLRDTDLDGLLTVESALEFGELLANDERLTDVRIAHLVPKQMLSRIDIDFGLFAAERQGKSTGRFAEPEQAMRWMKEGF